MRLHAVEDEKIVSELFPRRGKVVFEIVAALLAFAARHFFERKRFFYAFFEQGKHFLKGKAQGEEIEPRAAAHRSEVDDVVLLFAVAENRRKKAIFSIKCSLFR